MNRASLVRSRQRQQRHHPVHQGSTDTQPFRRLCTTLGASITVSEMALAQPLISGQSDEWALCRRHASEKTFGIQLAGGYPNRMVPAAEVIAKELGHNDGSGKGVDFVDVNLGCPIDFVFNQGAGSARRSSPLFPSRSERRVLGEKCRMHGIGKRRVWMAGHMDI